MPKKFTIDRTILARFLPNQEAIVIFEQALKAIGTLGTVSAQDTDNVAFTGGTIGLDAGTVASPSLYLFDPTSGFYRIGLDGIGVSIAGTELLALTAQLLTVVGSITVSGQLKSTVATGTPPLAVASSTKVPNLNAATVNGKTFDAPGPIGGTTAGTATFTQTAAGSLTSGASGFNGAAARGPYALPAAATDPASTMALANALRLAMIAFGLAT